mmetsp:Transcript_6888/g.7549  ORF Transcript_6888/g.7549 Transcript_6888/m.7549 type:complete len:216 (-) Transcript_6888:1673-2320(-)
MGQCKTKKHHEFPEDEDIIVHLEGSKRKTKKVTTAKRQSTETEYTYLFKILLLGDSGVGKTAVMTRYTQDTFADDFISTIGIDFRTCMVQLEGETVKVQIWDTAGQERFRSMTPSYYRGAQGIVLVYDITVESTFNSIEGWVEDVKTGECEENVELILVGNKVDLEPNRKISVDQGKALAKTLDVPFMETSAKTNTNIQNVFNDLVMRIREHYEK